MVARRRSQKKQSPDKPNKGIADRAMSRKINPKKRLDTFPQLVQNRPGLRAKLLKIFRAAYNLLFNETIPSGLVDDKKRKAREKTFGFLPAPINPQYVGFIRLEIFWAHKSVSYLDASRLLFRGLA